MDARPGWCVDTDMAVNVMRSGSPTRSSPRAPLVMNRATIRVAMYFGLALCDCCAIRAGFGVGVPLRDIRWMAPNGIELGWLVLALHIVLAARNGAYSRTALESAGESIRRASTALIGAACGITLLLFFQYAGPLVSRLAYGVSLASSLVFLLAARGIFHALFIWRRTDALIGKLLIVDGVAPPGQFDHVFDAQAAGVHPDLARPETLNELAALVAPYDRVVVAASPERQQAWAMLMKAHNVTGEIMIEGGVTLGAVAIDRFLGQDTVIVARGPMSLPNRIKKRTIDLLIAGAAVAFLAPLLILVVIAIKLDSPGPVVFAQTRVGRGNRWFKIYKFRSMRVESSDSAGTRSTSTDDDRITRVGRFIRKTSIDELPQLFNVLRGQMSIVGPRPHALGSLAGDKLFWEVSESYWLRHALKPGITGLAQVRGHRGATHEQSDLEDRLQSDLEYVNGWRLWRDVSIIFATLGVLIHPRAY